MDVGTGYRPLEIGEVHAIGDEWFRDGVWHNIAPKFVGLTYYGVSTPFRRPIANDSMDQFHEDTLQDSASTAPLDKEEVAKASEALLKAPNAKQSMGPAEKEARKLFGIPDDVQVERSDVLQLAAALDREHAAILESVRPATGASIDALIPLKPFTPNKYTRYIPTLDGRKVPVDVYCVLAAFPTGSSAVDHAVKKQLAPGQRGTKSRIQDLKEARDSLTRAIELEEAVEG